MFIDRLAALTGLAVVSLFLASPANALTMAECSVKYNDAKDAGTLNGQTWNQFRKAECGSDASAKDESKPAKKAKKSTAKATDESEDKGLSMADCSAKYQAAKDAGTLGDTKWNDFRKAECGPGASAKTVAAKKTSKSTATSDESDAKGLSMAECSDKYQAAKSAGTLNGMKWNDFRKSECGPGASAKTVATKKTSKSSSDDSEVKGLSMADCSAKYQAAKDAGTLGDMKWNDFRKAECGPGASARTVAVRKSSKSSSSDDTGKGLTMAECSAKYQAAKSGGTLNGMKWNDFRKAECGAGASDDDTVPATDEATYTGDPEKPSVKAPRGVKFPAAVSRKYSDETPGKARMHTCLDQYYANKDADTLNGLRWIQKGGGYYSLCNARLKS